MSTCTVDGCLKLADRPKRMCPMHRERLRVKGDVGPVGSLVQKRDSQCYLRGCVRPVLARQMCSLHYEKWRSQGDPLAPHGNTKHGHSPRRGDKSPEYHSWQNMVCRCTNTSRPRFADYGGRGITVCERWLGDHGFENFLVDMGLKPTSQHTIERIDNNKGYEPQNCRWATTAEQNQNTRANRMITLDGRTQHLEAWAKESGNRRELIASRLNRGGWDIRSAIFTPPEPKGTNQRDEGNSKCQQVNQK